MRFQVFFEVADEVAQLGGFFEVMRGGGFFHFRFKPVLHFAALAFQEIAGGLDLLNILFAVDIAHARGGAIFEMRVKTMLVIRRAGREGAATTQIELPPRH